MFRGVHDGDAADAQGGTAFGWGFHILPFIEQSALYGQFNSESPNHEQQPFAESDARPNAFAQLHLPLRYQAQEFHRRRRHQLGHQQLQSRAAHRMTAGKAELSAPPRIRSNSTACLTATTAASLRIAQITDGTSNQFMVAEAKWQMDGNKRNRGRIFGATDQATALSALRMPSC